LKSKVSLLRLVRACPGKLILCVMCLCTHDESAMAAGFPVQASLGSELVQRTLAMPIAEDNVFLVDDTIRYLGLKEESDLFRRYIKRVELMKKVDGVEIDRTVSAKQAIEKERYESLATLARLREAYYAKVIDIALMPAGEIPYQAQRSASYVQVAPSLWAGKSWNLPGVHSTFYFGVKITIREPLIAGSWPMTPEMKVVMNDGRELEWECSFSFTGLSREEAVRDWCSIRSRTSLDKGFVIALANDLAEGKGRILVHFTQPERLEDSLWPKSRERDGIDPRAWKAIANSTCRERGECLAYFFRSMGESQLFWLTAIGFVLGAILSAFLRIFVRSTAKILGIVVGAIVVGGAVALKITLAANSVFAFAVPYVFGLGGAGMVAGSLLICLLFKRGPDVATLKTSG
jgi:hypothetical protein